MVRSKGILRSALSQNLQELEKSGLTRTEQDSSDAISAIYAVTPLGTSVAPILETMWEWGQNYQSLVQIMAGS